MTYATYGFYKDTYLGAGVSEEAWPGAAARASAFLDYFTQGRAAKCPGCIPLQMACCALAELAADADHARAAARSALGAAAGQGQHLASERVGDYAVTYRDGAGEILSAARTAEALTAAMARTAARYLAGTGLTDRGGRRRRCTRPTP